MLQLTAWMCKSRLPTTVGLLHWPFHRKAKVLHKPDRLRTCYTLRFFVHVSCWWWTNVSTRLQESRDVASTLQFHSSLSTISRWFACYDSVAYGVVLRRLLMTTATAALVQQNTTLKRPCDGIHVPFDPCIVTIYTLRGGGGNVRAEGVRSGPSPLFLYIPTKTLFQR